MIAPALRPHCLFFASSCVLAGLALSGCGDSLPAERKGTVVIQVTDAPFSGTSQLVMTVNRIELVTVASESVQVFPSSQSSNETIALDLVKLRGRQQVVAIAEVPSGTFSGAEIFFLNAEASDGTGLAVAPQGGSVRLEFAERELVMPGVVNTILLDLDGAGSIVTTAPDSVELSPVLFVRPRLESVVVDEAAGVITDITARGFTFSPNAANIVTSPPTGQLGLLDVLVRPQTILVFDGVVFHGTAGLSALSVGNGVIVSGRFGLQEILADVVRVTRANAVNPLRLRGIITSLGSANFTMRLNGVSLDQGSQLIGVATGTSFAVVTSPSTSFLRRATVGPAGFGQVIPGGVVVVDGSFFDGSLNAAAVQLEPSTLAGDLTTLDPALRTGTLAVRTVNGVSVAFFPGVQNVALDLSTTSPFLGGVVPLQLGNFTNGQPVVASGAFVTPGGFSTDRLSLQGLSTFFGQVPLVGDVQLGVFTATIDGFPMRVVLTDSTRLLLRRQAIQNQIFNMTPGGFIQSMTRAIPPLSIQGRLFAGQIQATQVSMNSR